MDETVKKLEQRIAELEKQLSNLNTNRNPQIDEKDLETFKKVGAQLGYDFIDECGINECRVLIPKSKWPRIPMPQRCIYECTCGPCSPIDYRDFAALERFRGLGY